MSYKQFYRSRRIMRALQNVNECRANDEAKTDTDQTVIDYNNPIPGSAAENVTICDSIVSDSNLGFDTAYLSDDSVADPDYIPLVVQKPDLQLFDDNSEDCFQDLDLLEPTFAIENLPQPPPMQSPVPEMPIFIATYPNTIIFIDSEQADGYRLPARFTANYPGPIFDTGTLIEISDNSKETAKVIKNKTMHPMISKMCDGKCRRRCNNFTEKQRKDIWNGYWNLNYTQRRQFLNKCVKIAPVKEKSASVPNSFLTMNIEAMYVPYYNNALFYDPWFYQSMMMQNLRPSYPQTTRPVTFGGQVRAKGGVTITGRFGNDGYGTFTSYSAPCTPLTVTSQPALPTTSTFLTDTTLPTATTLPTITTLPAVALPATTTNQPFIDTLSSTVSVPTTPMPFIVVTTTVPNDVGLNGNVASPVKFSGKVPASGRVKISAHFC